MKIRTRLTIEDWAPLDRRWIAEVRLAGKTVWAFGATAEDAQTALGEKLAQLSPEGGASPLD